MPALLAHHVKATTPRHNSSLDTGYEIMHLYGLLHSPFKLLLQHDFMLTLQGVCKLVTR